MAVRPYGDYDSKTDSCWDGSRWVSRYVWIDHNMVGQRSSPYAQQVAQNNQFSGHGLGNQNPAAMVAQQLALAQMVVGQLCKTNSASVPPEEPNPVLLLLGDNS